jgi:hypothetical protein
MDSVSHTSVQFSSVQFSSVQFDRLRVTTTCCYSGCTVRAVSHVRLMCAVCMTPARQRLGKHFPEVTLSSTEARLKAGIVKSEETSFARHRLVSARLPLNYTRFRHNACMSNSSGTLRGGDFYPVLPRLQKEARPDKARSRAIWQTEVGFELGKAGVQKSAVSS